MCENRRKCHIRDAWHATGGPEGGRAQHGPSSGAHSTPGDQCQDARVVVLVNRQNGSVGDHISVCVNENQQKADGIGVVGT